ncbi:hypothetical protein PSBY109024_13940 [Pseudoalteromonas byunsanensis]
MPAVDFNSIVDFAKNYLTARGFMLSQFNDVGRGMLSCSLPENNDGLTWFTSFVVSYSD